MLLRVALCVIVIATTASAQWKRFVHMPHGEWSDAPPAHNLAYFRLDPCLRSDAKDRILQCGVERSKTIHTDLSFVGKIGPFTVYDLEYILNEGDAGSRVRSVLIETGPDQLHEIHVRGNIPLGTLFPTEVLDAGQQSLLKVKFDDGGIYHIVYEDYYVISQDGALLLDFEPVLEAASKVLPPDMVTWQPTSRFDFVSSLFEIRTEKKDASVGLKAACCEGRVEVPFRIERGRVIAGEAKYFPE